MFSQSPKVRTLFLMMSGYAQGENFLICSKRIRQVLLIWVTGLLVMSQLLGR